MKLVAPNLAALLLCSVAAASPDAEFKLLPRAQPVAAYIACKDKALTCPADQECFAVNPKGPFKSRKDLPPMTCMSAADTPKKCNNDVGCVYAKLGVACRNGKCYKAPPTQALNEACLPAKACDQGLKCYNSKCKKQDYASCADSTECGGVPCTAGVCKEAANGEPCTRHLDCSMYSYCSSATHICNPSLSRGAQCTADEACGTSRIGRGLKCYQGKCEAGAYQDACKTEGAVCADNLICELGKCVYRLQEGDQCEYSSQCEVGLCVDGACQRPGKDAGKCTNDADCSPGLLCKPPGKCCPPNSEDC